MLEPVNWKEGERSLQFGQFVHFCDGLPGVFRARMKQLEAIHRWLGSYFEAVSIMLQIPGGGRVRMAFRGRRRRRGFHLGGRSRHAL